MRTQTLLTDFGTESSLLSPAEVTRIIERQIRYYMRKWPEEISEPKEINYGFCFHFAMRLREKIPQAVIVDACTQYAHSWVRVGDRYYDAECPKGVTRVESLPFCKRLGVSEDEVIEVSDPLNPSENSWRRYHGENGSAYSNGYVKPEKCPHKGHNCNCLRA